MGNLMNLSCLADSKAQRLGSLQELIKYLPGQSHSHINPIQEWCTMAGRQLFDDPRLLRGRHHAELRLLWDGTILRGDHKRQASPKLLVRPGRMRLGRCEG